MQRPVTVQVEQTSKPNFERATLGIESPTPTGDPGPHTDALAKDTQDYLRAFLQFADQKAGFVFTVASALLALLYSRNAHLRWIGPPFLSGRGAVVALVAMSALVASAGFAVAVVVPRETRAGSGLFYWERIRRFSSVAGYIAALSALSADGVTCERANNCFDLADICRRKYRSLHISIWCGALGALLAATFLVAFVP
jgi:hypothetical protein